MVGYKVIFNTQVHEAQTPEQAAALLARAYRKGTPARLRVRETLTSDRGPTLEEQGCIVDLAAKVVLS